MASRGFPFPHAWDTQQDGSADENWTGGRRAAAEDGLGSASDGSGGSDGESAGQETSPLRDGSAGDDGKAADSPAGGERLQGEEGRVVHFPPDRHFKRGRHIELFDQHLYQDWRFIHRSNLLGIMADLLQTRDYANLAGVVETLFSLVDPSDELSATKGHMLQKHKALRQTLNAGLEVVMEADQAEPPAHSALKYLAAIRRMKTIPYQERTGLDLELAFCHLRKGDLTLAYETLAKTEKIFTGAVAKYQRTEHVPARSFYCALIRHLQWMDSLQRDAEKEKHKGYQPPDWTSARSLWHRASQQTRDYWTDACRHCQDRQDSAALTYLFVHLNLAAGKIESALEASAALAEAAPDCPDALGLHCLVQRVCSSSPSGASDRPTGDPGAAGQEESRRLVESHLRLLRQCPSSRDAVEGVWSLRRLLKPEELVGALLSHLDCQMGWGAAVTARQHTLPGAEPSFCPWRSLRSCLEAIDPGSEGGSGRESALGVACLLEARRRWWGRCWMFSMQPGTALPGASVASQGELLMDKAYCAIFVLTAEHPWCKSAFRAVRDGGEPGGHDRLVEADCAQRQLAALAGDQRDGCSPPAGSREAAGGVADDSETTPGRQQQRRGGPLPGQWWRTFPQRRRQAP